jgi:hypothetical protein
MQHNKKLFIKLFINSADGFLLFRNLFSVDSGYRNALQDVNNLISLSFHIPVLLYFLVSNIGTSTINTNTVCQRCGLNTDCMGNAKNTTVTGIIASHYIYQQVSEMQYNDLLTDSTKILLEIVCSKIFTF